ncbi:class I glutamine amidotransferase-like protein [Chytriomyces sp. MP71]|nr:class I glutamine amidotransferase-like protein [Chytriomyces sp. MP71]
MEDFTHIRRIAILVFPGADEMDFVGPLRVLRAAVASGKTSLTACDLVTYAPHSASDFITASHGMQVKPDSLLDAHTFGAYDLLMVVGGGWANRAPVGAYAEMQAGHVTKLLREVALANDKIIFASVCTGALLLAHAGILGEGQHASTYHSARMDLAAFGVHVVEDRVVVHQKEGGRIIVSSGGVTSGIDLALCLVGKVAGDEVADSIARGMEYERVFRF